MKTESVTKDFLIVCVGNVSVHFKIDQGQCTLNDSSKKALV